jgi:hypothetical protein
MHDGLGVSALDAASSVGGQAVKRALADFASPFVVRGSETAETAISIALLIDGCALGFDALCEELEELLGILMLARGEEGGAVLFWRVVGKGGDEGGRADGRWVRRGCIES